MSKVKVKVKDEYLAASIKHIQSRLGIGVVEIPEELVIGKHLLRNLIYTLQIASIEDFPIADHLMKVIQLKEGTNDQS